MSPTSAALIEERRLWLDSAMEGVIASCSQDLALYQWARYHLGWCDQS
jgi:hypothetical protein